MYKVIWDPETKGILLSTDALNDIEPPRPVFYEELDLLGFDKYWIYPKTEEPLLWSIGRKYYYKGEEVAIAKGGNIFDPPNIVLSEKGKNLSLEPINIKLMIEKNKDLLNNLESEAIDFIRKTYNEYKDKVDLFVVSYSGGKDSQVILDLATRALSPDEFIVIFTDTTMEMPPTYETYENTKKYYQNLYPKLKFYVARNDKHSLELWKVFGPPSRIIRWCCSVYKTSPQINLLRKLNKNITKIMVFDGVRADESSRRERYNRVAEYVKNSNQINAEIIKYWNLSEIFLYLYFRNLYVNEGYRYGLNRIGCSICPFSSEWSDYILNKVYNNVTKKYLEEIINYSKGLIINDHIELTQYIKEGNWKIRSGSYGNIDNNVSVDIIEYKNYIKFILSNPKENFLEWIKTIGDIRIIRNDGEEIEGEIFTKINGNSLLYFLMTKYNNNLIIIIKGSFKSIIDILKKILYKAAYCIKCGSCVSECPNNAILIYNNNININKSLCKSCLSCIKFEGKGCVLAKSIENTKGDKYNMDLNIEKYEGFGKYLSFGMREEWINSFLLNPENWIITNNLGPKQKDSMIFWLKDSELIEKKDKKLTEFSSLAKEIYFSNKKLFYELILINLFYNSSLINWFFKEIENNAEVSSNDLFNIAKIKCKGSDRTIKNGINSLINTFENSSLSKEIRFIEINKKSGLRYIKKLNYEILEEKSALFLLYRYAYKLKKYRLTLKELFDPTNKFGTPYTIFNADKKNFKNLTIILSEKKPDFIKTEYNSNLENINLNENIFNYYEVLK